MLYYVIFLGRIFVMKLFPKRWPLSNPNRSKIRKGNVTETLTPNTGNRDPQQNYRLGTASNKFLGGLN